MLRRLLLVTAALVTLTAPAFGAAPAQYKTRNVIVAVMDGVRYQDTFGDPKRALIPNLATLEKDGTLLTNFRIAGPGISVTRQGHSTLSTGTWQTVALGGARMTMPSFCEYARNELGWKQTDCWVIFGKGKYSYAGYSSFPGYGADYRPSFVNSIGEAELKNDDAVLDKVISVMDSDKPRLMFVNFGYTDHIAHVGTFAQHQESIRHCDEMFGKLWKKVQSTPGYKDTTTVFFTNDHGRHNDKAGQPENGFKDHGDKCDGCRHLMLLAVGPDTKPGATVESEAEQIDLCPTVGELLGFQTPFSQGKVITECLAQPLGLNTKVAKTPAAKEGERLVELSGRDLIKRISEANLARDPGSLKPNVASEMLMRGMLKAATATKDNACRDYVAKWVEKNAADAATNPRVARVMLELSQGAKEVDLSKVRECAAKIAQDPKSADPLTTCANAAFLARAGQLLDDAKLKAAAKTALGLDAATQDQQVADFRKIGVKNVPMACDVPAAIDQSVTLADAMALAALIEASEALPEDKMVRLACNIKECVCSQGRPEFGANWTDPAQSAITLGALVSANQIAPRIIWTNDAPPQGMKKFTGQRWAFPTQVFYYDSIVWQMQALRYLVDERGHFAKGDPMSDGAMLNMLCDTRDKKIGGGQLRTMMN